MISEVQHHIDAINQKEAFSNDDTTKLLVNEAMQDITFNFSKIGEEEMKMISGGVELQDKWQRTIRGFTQMTPNLLLSEKPLCNALKNMAL